MEQKRERESMVSNDEDALPKAITLSDASNPHDVEEMLRDAGGAALFEEFCQSEAIDHYVRFWLKIEKLRKYEK